MTPAVVGSVEGSRRVDTFELAMFVHIIAMTAGFMMAATLHVALYQSRSATRVAEMKPWPRVIHRVEPLLPVTALVIFFSGMFMISRSDGEFAWKDPWLLASIVGLVLAEIIGASLVPRSKAFQAAIVAAPEGPVGDDLRPAPVLWIGSHSATALFLGVVYLMVMKPSGPVSVGVLVVAEALGIATALPLLRKPAVTAAGVPTSART